MNRRDAVTRIAAVTGSIAGTSAVASVAWAQTGATPSPARPEPLDRDQVHKFVVAAHGDLEAVKAMLAEEPRIVNATWDWGAGDFETALGGASHMARPDIARFLLEHGARMDVFCATMLGKIDVVKACVDDDPAIVHVKGPHGIPLLRHAELAKQESVVRLLKAAGA